MVAGKSRPVKNGMFPNSSWGGHVEKWGFSGSGTILVLGHLVGPWTAHSHATSMLYGHGVSLPWRCLSTICPSEQWEELGACRCYSLGSAEVLNTAATGSTFGEALTASGEETFESGTPDRGRRKRRQAEARGISWGVHQKRTSRQKCNMKVVPTMT